MVTSVLAHFAVFTPKSSIVHTLLLSIRHPLYVVGGVGEGPAGRAGVPLYAPIASINTREAANARTVCESAARIAEEMAATWCGKKAWGDAREVP